MKFPVSPHKTSKTQEHPIYEDEMLFEGKEVKEQFDQIRQFWPFTLVLKSLSQQNP